MPVDSTATQPITPHAATAPAVAPVTVPDSVLAIPADYEPELVSVLDTALYAAAGTTAATDTAAMVEQAPPPEPWTNGLPGIPRPGDLGHESGIMAIIVTLFLLIALNYRHCRRMIGTLMHDLWSMRKRANVFDEHTSNEARVLLLMILQLVVYGGILLYNAVAPRHGENPNILPTTLALIGLCGGYHIFQLMAYSVVGYAFADPDCSSRWLRGFNASQALLGLALTVPTLVIVFYPDASSAMLIAAVSLYIMARLAFISKGFRIFYHNLPSLLYLILYLCALEIIPVIFVYFSAQFIVDFFR